MAVKGVFDGIFDIPVADRILRLTQFFYSVVLLAAFIGCAAWYSVVNSKKEEDVIVPTVRGPGGKPLPITKKRRPNDGTRKIGPGFGRTAKNVFRYLAAVVFLTYVASGISMFDHAFWHEDPYEWSKEGLPWAGEWSVVCQLLVISLDMTIARLFRNWLIRSRTDPCHGRHILLSLHPNIFV